MTGMHRAVRWCLLLALSLCSWSSKALGGEKASLPEQAEAAIAEAARFYHGQVASHGGYVYYYSLDLQQRWGEGVASADQIWVQPPGTPTVGMAYLKAYAATGDPFYLHAATEAAEALVYGQLESGGWTNCIDFDPQGERVARYRNGKGNGKDNSTLDDGISQAAMQLLMQVDQARGFEHQQIHRSAGIALDALLEAQFPNGGFPQVWTGPTSPQPVVAANYPPYDWRSEGRIKNYWDMYTLNDGVAGSVAETLIEAWRIYEQPRYKAALAQLGDFLILAQMPDPQPGWAQQYNYEMQPIWARKFEPPAITGGESQDAMEALMMVYRYTGNTGKEKYLEPIPRALDYLKRSLLPDGQLARYYELKTNRPLYMKRRGDVYTLTYDDSDLPRHYGWKIPSRLDQIEREYEALKRDGDRPPEGRSAAELEAEVRRIVGELDEQGRWISVYRGGRMVGQPKFPLDSRFISSKVFSQNLERLSEYVASARQGSSDE